MDKKVALLECTSDTIFGTFKIKLYANSVSILNNLIQMDFREFQLYQAKLIKISMALNNAYALRELYMTNTDNDIEIIQL